MPNGHPPEETREDFVLKKTKVQEQQNDEIIRKKNDRKKWLRKGPRALWLAITDPRFRRHLSIRKAIYTTMTLGMFAIGGNKTHAGGESKSSNHHPKSPSNQIAMAKTTDSGSFRIIEDKDLDEKENEENHKSKKTEINSAKNQPKEVVSAQTITPPSEINMSNILEIIESQIDLAPRVKNKRSRKNGLKESSTEKIFIPEITNPHTGRIQLDFNKLSINNFVLDKKEPSWPLIEGLRFGKRLLLNAGDYLDQTGRGISDIHFERNDTYEVSERERNEWDIADEIVSGFIDIVLPKIRINNGFEFKHSLRRNFYFFRNNETGEEGPQSHIGVEFRHRYQLRIDTPQLKDLKTKLFATHEFYNGITGSVIYASEFSQESGFRDNIAIGMNFQINQNMSCKVELKRDKNGETELSVGFNIIEALSPTAQRKQEEFNNAFQVFEAGEASKNKKKWDEGLSFKKVSGKARSMIKKSKRNASSKTHR
ncbi:MAG: hypothetical protein P1V18_05020 [Candidatus Gracilibacteria bacterium]|nr:hypothetical protein [Candidatus Gracilibacteria bacterium]